MAGAAAVGVIHSVSALNLHFRANRKNGLGALVSPARRLNFGLSVTCSNLVESNAALLEAAAKHTVDTFIKNGMVVGLGSGLASCMAIQYLGQQLRLGAVKHIVGIPTSVGSASEAAKAGIPLDQYEDSSQRLQGEESIIQEKSILKAAEKLVFIVMEKQYKGGLEGSIPVLIKSYNWMETAEEIDDLFLGDAEVWRRPSIGHAGPLGGDFPLITREGHNVLDVIFTSPIPNLAEIAKSLDNIDGVVDHGVICRIPCTVVLASEDGFFIVENSPKEAERGI